MDGQVTNEYIRQVLHHTVPPPTIETRFFYTSAIPIDDPLSALPPSGAGGAARQAPKPFSEYDNSALDKAWHALRSKILKYHEERGEKEVGWGHKGKKHERSASISKPSTPHTKPLRPRGSTLSQVDSPSDDSQSIDNLDIPSIAHELPETTGNPFIRAPSRGKTATLSKSKESRTSRPRVQAYDTYIWEDPSHLAEHSPAPEIRAPEAGPTDSVAVGVSRLHQVEMPDLKMTPIYWSPVNDVAAVVRGTWFYQDTMLPVETPVAILLEAGYVELQVWTQTWKDELDSAIEVGASGEMKIVHKLWPEKAARHSLEARRNSGSRPSTAAMPENLLRTAVSNLAELDDSPEARQTIVIETAADLIDISNGAGGADNKAAGTNTWGRHGATRTYQQCGVIYADAREARILKPNLLPSAYYGRRPLANYIRKGRGIGVAVVRGFDQAIWDKLHPSKSTAKARKAEEGVATSASGVAPETRRKDDPELARAERPRVTDLVLVIHGIGQKLSQRMEAWHFTHAINAFRREVNVEVGTKECKARFRRDMGSIMVLPVNWRHTLSFEEGGYRNEDPAVNEFTLADITPDTLPSVRNIVSDVMLDVPYYMSQHQSKMIAAVVKEANRVYRLWCTNNPGFAEHGRVHIIGHSLGSVMSVEILSRQPTKLPQHLADPVTLSTESIADIDHFLFNTHNLFLAGSPAGFFLLLKKAQLLPRIDSSSAAALDDPSSLTLDICGKQGQYGCIAVENIYNLINGYDPVAYRMNATVDSAYASYLKKAWVPTATTGWFNWSSPQPDIAVGGTTKPDTRLPRLPSTVEMETHNFSREQIGEKRMRLLNDNAQVDFFIRYGGGPLDIQYLTMLSAHASYWLLRDFTRMIVLEIGRPKGPNGTLLSMRAQKGKG
ncbi:hypothetical protein AMS68_005212 [Peltaster fructicola]|uniref:DDHD domain-containing protein n=1 Tax=Peltaster fructicola TaxID=286661 RepID=A0A6H0XYF8_9PEZI|nr:hypothetical protein AMS68_005212 [Peltaster fructicola]